MVTPFDKTISITEVATATSEVGGEKVDSAGAETIPIMTEKVAETAKIATTTVANIITADTVTNLLNTCLIQLPLCSLAR